MALALPVWLALELAPAKYATMQDARSVTEAVDLFKQAGFDPQAVRHGRYESIPRVYFATLPHDLNAVQDIDLRKAVFVSVVLPHVLQANERIRSDRQRLIRIRADIKAEKTLRGRDRRWLDDLARRYKTKPMDTEALLRRVDIVPPRLAMAQSAQESGWGTSRFARSGNALFGQHAPPGENAIKARKAEGVALRAFDTIQGSVHGYVHNLNTHRAYRGFRDMRADMRARGERIDGHLLAATLGAYSEEGVLYVQRLRSMMQIPAVASSRNVRLGTAN